MSHQEFIKLFRQAQLRDARCQPVREKINSQESGYCWRLCLLYMGDMVNPETWRLLVPGSLVLRKAHADGHFGALKCYLFCKKILYWKVGMKKDFARYVKNCSICAKPKVASHVIVRETCHVTSNHPHEKISFSRMSSM